MRRSSSLSWLLVILCLLTQTFSLATRSLACGVERWSVKTGTDADNSLVNVNSSTATTVASLDAFPSQSSPPANNRISPYETTVWVINATLVEYKLETDQDYHLVLHDASGNSLIAEIPAPSCVGSGSPFAAGITNARAEMDARFSPSSSFQTTSIPVQVTGVGMFDFAHGQTGAAPNQIELHPVLDIVFNPTAGSPTLSSVSVSPTSVTGGGTATGTVTLTAPATSSTSISLSSSNSSAATVPSSVTVPSGSSSASFIVNTSSVASSTNVTLTATGGSVSKTATLTVNASGGGTTQLLGNPGFETGTASPWTAASGIVDNSTSEAAHSGSWKAWMDGYGSAHTDTLLQQVTIPSTVSTATLSFWLHIDTAETTTTTAYDTLQVQIRNSSGTVLTTLATYSNLNANTGYVQKTFNLASYLGQTIQVYLIGVEDSSQQTSFVVDDFALNVQ